MRLTGTITAIFFWFSKIGKISFQKGKKRKRENGTFGINFADLLLGHKQEKKYIQPSLRNQLGFILQTTFRKR